MTVRPSVLSDQGSWQTLLAILGIILGIAIVVAAAMFGPGLIRTWLRRAKRRRRIINRRRNRR
jgi:threonine/homoserine/homoserine lactone efflux protein